MRILSPYSSWRDRLLTLGQVLLFLTIPIAVWAIFWSGEGMGTRGRTFAEFPAGVIH